MSRFVAVDLETTGLDPAEDRIIEIGAVRFEEGVESGRFSSLVYPGRQLPEEIVRLTGITDFDLKDAPYAAEVLPGFKEFIGKDPLAAQNAPFDIGFLRAEFARQGEIFQRGRSAEEIAFDTAVLSRALIPELESHSLTRLADYFKIEGGQRHRAEDDARRCGLVLLKLAELLTSLGSSEAYLAGKILGSGVMGDMFRGLAKHLTESGAKAEPSSSGGYSYNRLGEIDPDEEIESIPGLMEEIFRAEGLLARNMPVYESRQKQWEMAADCAEALFSKRYLLAEAGTGTGKSFAYLIPAVLFSVSAKKRVVVSTNTRNLQEQLFSKDIPFLVKVLPCKFQAALLKGRSNYLCRRKWGEMLADPDYFLAEDERTRALALLFWANRTITGDIAENSGFNPGRWGALWNKFASEAGSCAGSKCSQRSGCYLQKARQAALKSHITVANHALVLTDIAAGNAVLGEYNHLILDEAHNLEKAASNHLGLEANIYKTRAFINRLHRKDGALETGLLPRLRRKFAGDDRGLLELIEPAVMDVYRLRSEAGEFFAVLSEAARLEQTSPDDLMYSFKRRYGPGGQVIGAAAFQLQALLEGFVSLAKSLRRIAEELAEKGEDVTEESAPGLELSSSADEALRMKDEIEELAAAKFSDWVYWYELPRREGPEIRLQSAPLDPGEILAARMYPWLESVIFTSATMKVGGGFDYIKGRLGLNLLEDREAAACDYGSPFDFQRQALFAAPVFLPGPKSAVEFTDSIARLLTEITLTFRRGALALFTSYRQLNEVYNQIRVPLMKAGFPLMGQGIDGSRSDLLRRFLNDRALLLGTDSFWEGIDAPGVALEILLITKLPFEVPSEPIVAAKIEKLEREGLNPFLEYSVPEAAVKLRQGVGRLIRSASDTGAVIICDKRMVNSRWGVYFRDSLPGKVEVFGSVSELLGAMGEVLGN